MTDDLFDERKDGQEKILERSNKLGETHMELEGEHDTSLVNATSEIPSLSVANGKEEHDQALKIESLFSAVHNPALHAAADDTAGSCLVHIPELLDLILQQLPTKDLLPAQKRTLIFLPAPINQNSTGQGHTVVANPLLEFNSTAGSMPVLHVDRTLSSFFFGVTDIHSTASDVHRGEDIVERLVAKVRLNPVCIAGSCLSVYGNRKCYSTGSWRRMYLMQQPCAVEWKVRRSNNSVPIAWAATCGEQYSEESYAELGPMTAQAYTDYTTEQAKKRKAS